MKGESASLLMAKEGRVWTGLGACELLGAFERDEGFWRAAHGRARVNASTRGHDRPAGIVMSARPVRRGLLALG